MIVEGISGMMKRGIREESASPTCGGAGYFVRVALARCLLAAAGLGIAGGAGADMWDPYDDNANGGTSIVPSIGFQWHGPHTLQGNDLYDWFRIWMSAGYFYHFDSNGGVGDSYAELFADIDGTMRVAANDDGGYGVQFSFTYLPATSQEYFLRVRKYSQYSTTATWSGNINYVSGVPGTVPAPMGSSVIYECVTASFTAVGCAPGGGPIRYEWDFNGDNIADHTTWYYDSGEVSTVSHSFTTPGIYAVRAKIIDYYTGADESAWSLARYVQVLDIPENDAGMGEDASEYYGSALRIPPGSHVGYAVDVCDDEDNYKFYAATGEVITWSLTPTAGDSWYVALRDPSYVLIDDAYVSAGGTVVLTATSYTTGWWHAEIRPAYNSGGAYGFTLAGVSNPALLRVGTEGARSTINVGQTLEVRMSVTNVGGATATGVTPAIEFNAGGGLIAAPVGPTPGGPLDLAAGGNQVFVWTYSTSFPGYVEFTATATGTDSYTLESLEAGGTGGVYIQTPASLISAVSVSGTSFKQGRQIEVVATVTNTGQAFANSVTPVCVVAPATGTVAAVLVSGPSPAGPAQIGGGASQSFTWIYEAQDVCLSPNLANFTVTATGVDGNDDAALSTTVYSAALEVTPAAVLKSAAWLSAGVVEQGEAIVAYLSITNTGANAALSVSVSLWLGSSLAVVAGPTPAGPMDIAGGGTNVTFQWSLLGVVPGSCALSVSATGAESDGTVVGASHVLGLNVSSLLESAGTAQPAVVRKGDAITLRLDVNNTGSVTASLGAPVLEVSDPRLVTVTGVTLPAATLPGGGTTACLWQMRAEGAGRVMFTASIAGSAGGIPLETGSVVPVVIEIRFQEGIVVFPNPVRGDAFRVALRLEATAAEVTVMVFNMSRDKVYTGTWRNLEQALSDLDISGVSGWAPGLYLVYVRAKLIDGREQRFPVMKVMVRR